VTSHVNELVIGLGIEVEVGRRHGQRAAQNLETAVLGGADLEMTGASHVRSRVIGHGRDHVRGLVTNQRRGKKLILKFHFICCGINPFHENGRPVLAWFDFHCFNSE